MRLNYQHLSMLGLFLVIVGVLIQRSFGPGHDVTVDTTDLSDRATVAPIPVSNSITLLESIPLEEGDSFFTLSPDGTQVAILRSDEIHIGTLASSGIQFEKVLRTEQPILLFPDDDFDKAKNFTLIGGMAFDTTGSMLLAAATINFGGPLVLRWDIEKGEELSPLYVENISGSVPGRGVVDFTIHDGIASVITRRRDSCSRAYGSYELFQWNIENQQLVDVSIGLSDRLQRQLDEGRFDFPVTKNALQHLQDISTEGYDNVRMISYKGDAFVTYGNDLGCERPGYILAGVDNQITTIIPPYNYTAMDFSIESEYVIYTALTRPATIGAPNVTLAPEQYENEYSVLLWKEGELVIQLSDTKHFGTVKLTDDNQYALVVVTDSEGYQHHIQIQILDIAQGQFVGHVPLGIVTTSSYTAPSVVMEIDSSGKRLFTIVEDELQMWSINW